MVLNIFIVCQKFWQVPKYKNKKKKRFTLVKKRNQENITILNYSIQNLSPILHKCFHWRFSTLSSVNRYNNILSDVPKYLTRCRVTRPSTHSQTDKEQAPLTASLNSPLLYLLRATCPKRTILIPTHFYYLPTNCQAIPNLNLLPQATVYEIKILLATDLNLLSSSNW